MKMLDQRKVSIKSFVYRSSSLLPEFVVKILDECTEVTDRIEIAVLLPREFVYTPLRPFKTRKLHITGKSNWYNPDCFMNCRRVSLRLGFITTRTKQSYNSLFSNWMDSDSPLQHLTLCIDESKNQWIMDALNNQLVFLF
uniref:FBA_2 domain-containing protein n=1 Tax=Caenorhabditis tropicalis TaxID=1561998 RepID=A0A1I7UET6_9PELO